MPRYTSKEQARRKRAVHYIQKFIGKPYIYGGQGPDGFCCSGIIVATLRGVGKLKTKEDLSAAALYERFHEAREQTIPYGGCLIFWFDRKGDVEHVAMLIDNQFIVEAGAGDRETLTAKDAARDDAMVRMRELDYRGRNYKIGERLKIIDPFKE